MRRFLSASLVALAVAGALAHEPGLSSDSAHPGGRRRKTLGFGPTVPHAVFRTAADAVPLAPQSTFGSDNPFFVADDFVARLLRKDGVAVGLDNFFVKRDDSYEDKNTGVAHVYFRQFINGFPVANGDINVNVKDGIVISYGDSFYRGSVPSPMTNPASQLGLQTPWEVECEMFAAQIKQIEELNYVGSGQQTVLGSSDNDGSQDVTHLNHLFETNCWSHALLSELSETEYASTSALHVIGDPRHAALQFILTATGDNELAQDIINRYDEMASNITITFDTSLVGHVASDVMLLHNVPDTVNPVKAHFAYVQVPNGKTTELSLVWKLEVEMPDNWYEAAVTSNHPHKIVSVVDWVSDAPEGHFRPKESKSKPGKKPTPEPEPEGATYQVFPWGVNDPECGKRTIEKEGVDKLASPIGWHSIPADNDPKSDDGRYVMGKVNNYTTTWGNNVFAHENWEGRNAWVENYRPDAGSGKEFHFKYDPHPAGGDDSYREAQKYINATVAQLFYTANQVHDLYYRYGFDEVSGNFQQHNFGRGGKENDAVIANAQDGSGYNNANFATPPDGQNGRCRMYLWNTAEPYRDGDLEAGIVIHELSHGLSTRLTGGPANSGCLGWGESGGMGEGWGDFLATMIRSNSTYTDFPMGAWAANRGGGIRNYPYSLDETINPSTYKTLDKPGYWGVHAIGEVWAEILWVVAQKLIKLHGFSETLFPPLPLEDGTVPEGDFYRPQQRDAQGRLKPLVPKHGNSLIFQLVLNGMKLQKCMPSFFDARDAIIQADQVLTGGENFCLLWHGFGERGLGEDAKVEGRTPWGGGIRTDGYKLPYACRKETIPEPDPKPTPPDDGDDDDDDEDWIAL